MCRISAWKRCRTGAELLYTYSFHARKPLQSEGIDLTLKFKAVKAIVPPRPKAILVGTTTDLHNIQLVSVLKGFGIRSLLDQLNLPEQKTLLFWVSAAKISDPTSLSSSVKVILYKIQPQFCRGYL